jgi:cell wall-associated NlpC family hydrolase
MNRGRKTLGALALAGVTMWLLTPGTAVEEEETASTVATLAAVEDEVAPELPAPARRRRSWRRRAALTLVYTAIFFAGGALAAGAGNELAQVDAGSTDPVAATTTDATATDATTTDATTTDTTTDGTTTAVDDTTTTEPTETTETTPDAMPTTTTDTAAPAPDPSDATPSLAAPAVPPAPSPVEPVVHRVRRVQQQTGAQRQAQPPAQSPFPVLTFDPQAWLVDHPGTPAGDAAVAIAEQYLGVPYTWGGNRPSTGFDCSGLTQFVYAQLGIWLPHYAAAQFLAYPRIDPTQLEPGDLVFFEPKPDGPGHVAIYAGGDTIVEAPHTGAVVRIDSLSGTAASLGFLGAVRPTAGVQTLPTVQLFAVTPGAGTASGPANGLARAA